MVTAQCHAVDTACISWVLRAGLPKALLFTGLHALKKKKKFSEDTLRNPPFQGFLIGSELSFINGTDYMQA